ncbi:GYF domain-containing protein, partial [Candidatus Paracaedibacter symbiosus]|uniref:GYF domain-containing protein n=1 Tax=Candidatus Paracaedibacter symbiosus TaxID=244582 RepID=UPI0005097F4F
MSMLWLRSSGQTEGPLPINEVRDRFKTGELAAGTMSWGAGEQGWQSLGRRWGHPPQSRAWHWLAWSLLLAGAAALAGWSFIWQAQMPLVERSGVSLVSSGAWLAAALAAMAAVYALLVSLPRRRLAAPAVYALLVAGLSTALALPQQRIRANVFRALQMQPDASVQASDGVLTIQGEVGPRLLADVERTHDAHPGIRLVVIDSTGGLIDEAQRVGRWIGEQALRYGSRTNAAVPACSSGLHRRGVRCRFRLASA